MAATIVYLVGGIALGQLMMAYMMLSYRQLSEKKRVAIKVKVRSVFRG
ncbi:MAG: hypothetical protein JKY60_15590 [Kordiimonadaceae bacterium]|nr:hypothetical protein [Kordiimonadaceae bacterium]MBL4790394.1 hypothetical protein [Kordiimonadaceae bacterium]